MAKRCYMVYCLNLNYCLCLCNSLYCCLSLYNSFLCLCLHSSVHFLYQWCFLCLHRQFTCFSLFSAPIVLQFIFMIFTNSIPDLPNNVPPSPRSTKKMHVLHLLLFSIFTLQLPECVIVVLFYVFSLIFTSFVAASWSTVVLVNNFLYKGNGIMFL